MKKLISQERKEHKIQRESSAAILKQIVVIAIPITIGAAVMPIVNIIDTEIVTSRLIASGWEKDVAVGLYGQLTSFCGALVNFPQVLTQAVAMSLVPLVAAAWKQKDMDHLRTNVESGLRMAVMLGMPCAVGLFVLAEPILLLLYSSQEAAAISAAPCLMVLSIGVVFLAVVQTLTGVLQGVGKQMIPVRNLVIAVIVKIVITWVLTGIYSVNILGAAAGTVTAYAIAAILDVIAVKKYTGTHFNLKKTVVKPFISSAAMGLVTWGTFHLLYNLLDGSRLATLIAIMIAVVVYAVMIFATKTITREELATMPKGNKLVKILDKFTKRR
jgi:stage V sporulation protein B